MRPAPDLAAYGDATGGLTHLTWHVGLGGPRQVARLGAPLGLASALPAAVPEVLYLHQGFGPGTTLVTGADGATVEERLFEPYGANLLASADYTLEPHGWNAKPMDPWREWIDHGARWHATPLGRWTAADPPLRSPDGLLKHGLDASTYGFVAGNPVMFWDPDGNAIPMDMQCDCELPNDWPFVLSDGIDFALEETGTKPIAKWLIRQIPIVRAGVVGFEVGSLLGDLFSSDEDETSQGNNCAGSGPRPQQGSKPVPADYKPFTKDSFRDNLAVLTGVMPDAGRFHAHDVFPKDLGDRFRSAVPVTNIHAPEYGPWFDRKTHLAKSTAINRDWRNFFAGYTEGAQPTLLELKHEGRRQGMVYGFDVNY